uniref:ATP synthase subunit a n=1 Tax=Dermatophagoides pteronyssinus TaxID=6956 RepID=C1IWC3_DERPT|nr:ATP synthase F0 subunit 6 [Dermatophagoides pteronyssinus]ACF54662.1 ATP synthase F0 subunit 6 [Dermatophagoides pteronyssinus]
MMMNLFSIFDPSLSLFSISWVMCGFVFVLFPSLYWVGGMYSYLFLNLFCFSKKEVDYSVSKVAKGVYKMILSIFICIMLYNFFAIFPHIFSITSHLLVTFPLSYSFWVGIILFSLYKSLKDFLIHLIPTGTPLGLISFMVVVELLSNFIRPMALTFRLTANMMAGHLLMSLIGNAVLFLPTYFLIFGAMAQSLLVFMELGVSIIQAYVFSTLLLLYLSEGESSH